MEKISATAARSLLEEKFPQWAPIYPIEAKRLLDRYHSTDKRFDSLRESIGTQELYQALYIYSLEVKTIVHENDVKRAQRSKGEKLRKVRTKSRRG